MVVLTLDRSPRRQLSGATEIVSEPGASNLVP
jgi:hypothetical protein